jgi:3-deoxy-D-manno-octulosonate 8-phosphate phosphatase KdsC-like HAD superfamily phosphatase
MKKYLLCEIEGVLTDFNFSLGTLGLEFYKFNKKDFLLLDEAKQNDIEINLICNESNSIFSNLSKKYKLPLLIISDEQKKLKLVNDLKELKYEVHYIGYGLADLFALMSANVSYMPQDSIVGDLVDGTTKSPSNQSASLRLNCRGGDGCLYEVLEYMIQDGAA